jgi:hypothetical protein
MINEKEKMLLKTILLLPKQKRELSCILDVKLNSQADAGIEDRVH